MIKKVNLKLFIENPEDLEVEAVIPVFHRWIQENVLAGMPIDVADYKHVPDGPGIMLIGHDGDYAIDFANGRPGVWYSHKREWAATDLQGQIRLAWTRLITAVNLLQNDNSLDFTVSTSELELTFPDRLNAPNNAETFAAVSPEVQTVLTDLFGGADVKVEWLSEDARRPFAIRATIENAPALADLSVLEASA